MAAGDLTTLANVKQWLGIATANDDALLSRMVTALSRYVQTWLNRQLATQSYAEVRDGHGGTVMLFADYPVTAVASVSVDGVAIPAASDRVAPGYRFDDRCLYLQGYRFTRGHGNVDLTYTAGYASTPPEIEQAVIELIGLRYKERDRIGHQSKSLAGETVTFIVRDFPDDVRTILNNYKKVIPL